VPAEPRAPAAERAEKQADAAVQAKKAVSWRRCFASVIASGLRPCSDFGSEKKLE
jgi:hypothetical protein